MEYRDSADISGASVNRAGGSRGSAGGRIAVGGGGSLVVLILALIFGLDPSGLLGGSTGTGEAPAANPVTQCTRGSDVAKNRECRWNAYLASIGAYWSGAYDRRHGEGPVQHPDRCGVGVGTARAYRARTGCPSASKTGDWTKCDTFSATNLG
jgi:predicted metalloprotease